MRNFLLFVYLLKGLFLFAQVSPQRIDTTAAAECKTSLYTEFKKKFEVVNKNITYSNSAERNIIKEVFNETQNEFLERIKNGEFLCNSDVNPYLQGIFNEILNKNNINTADYKILLSKDSEVNASNLGNGIVVLNYGMFLALDNEDELAFVISHEVGHQFLNHVKNQIETFAKISTSEDIIKKTKEIQKQKYGKATKANDLLKTIVYQNYSQRRKKEIAADSLGLVFYKKTLRNPKAALAILEKLDTVDEEKDSLIVKDYKAFFEKTDFKIKDKYFTEEESLFKQYDGERRLHIDSLKSHPDCAARIKLVQNMIQNPLQEKVTASKAFTEIKQHSIYQNLFNLYSQKQYGTSLYESLKLYKNDKANTFYKSIIYLNLQEIYKSRRNYTINRYVQSYDKKQNTASENRFITFINNIQITDLEIITTTFKPS